MRPGGESRARRPRNRLGAEAFAVSPFNRLARTHALSVAGDTLLTIALADSLFFDVDPNDARWKVGAYLLLTLAPFAIVAPFLGPVMDRLRGGHRYMIIGTAVARAMLMAALVVYVQRWLLFPLAFSMLVMGKTYAVAKSALVPTLVPNEAHLVRSNSRLSILSALSGAAIGLPGVILLRLGGAPWVLGLGMIVFLAAAVLGFRIPATRVASRPAEQEEKIELRGHGIRLGSSAMGYLRGGVGFVTMLLAFDLRGGIDPGPTSAGVEIGHRVRESLGLARINLETGGSPPWHFGVALIGVGIGGLLGSAGVPRLRSRLAEERILAFDLIGLTALAVLAAISTGLAGAFIVAFAMALAAQGGKQAFDAIVQRDAPMANLGRVFSRFESRFQLVWVLGALIPVVIPLPARVGYIILAVTAAFVAATYWFGRTPNPSALVSDGVVDNGLDRLAGTLPAPIGKRLRIRNNSRGGDPGRGADDATGARRRPEADRRSDRADSPDRPGKRGGRRGPAPRRRGYDPTGQMPRPHPGDPVDDDATQIFPDAPPPAPPVVRPRGAVDSERRGGDAGGH
jgi:MFS family permease